jgi:hypothetical protein
LTAKKIAARMPSPKPISRNGTGAVAGAVLAGGVVVGGVPSFPVKISGKDEAKLSRDFETPPARMLAQSDVEFVTGLSIEGVHE